LSLILNCTFAWASRLTAWFTSTIVFRSPKAFAAARARVTRSAVASFLSP
jgi:hypothetical protein